MKKAVIVLFCFIAILNNSAYAQNGLFNDEKNNILIKNVYDHGYHTVPNLYDVDENGIWLNYFDYDNFNYHKLLLGYNGIFYNANSPLFYNGIAKINYNGKYGYINEEYEWIVPPIFDYASDFKSGYGYLLNNSICDSEYGRSKNLFVDKSGNIVFRCDGEFEKFESGNGYEVFSNGYAYFKIEDKQYILDSAFNLIETKINENSIGLGKYVYSGLVPNKTGGTIVYSFIENNDNGSIIKNYMIGYDGEIKYINTNLNCTDNSTYFDDYIILNNGYVLFGGYNQDKTNKDGNLTLVSNNGEIIFQKNMERKEPFFNGKEKHPNKFTFINDFLCYKDKIYNLSMEEINYIDFSLKINFELFKNLNEANINFRDININCIGNNKIYVCLAGNMVGYNNENGFVNLSSIEKLAIYCEENIKINLEPMSVNTKYIMYENLSSIKIYINNKKINFDVPPITDNDRTLVPMRAIFEALGAEVEWENETQTATATKDGITVSVTIDSNMMLKNGEEIELDVPARLVGDSRTLVPLRAISEAFGCRVEWDEELQRADIYTN